MKFECANKKHIHYNVVKVDQAITSRDDYFSSDMKGIIKSRPSNSRRITEFYYITGIECPNGFTNRNSSIYKLKVYEMLREFINKFPKKVIILRLGYDDSIVNEKEKEDNIYKMVEDYTAAISAGFYDISNLICLEFSKTLIYNNSYTWDIIELSARCEALFFSGNDDYNFVEIINKIYS